MKSKTKKVNNKLKSVEERESKLKIDKLPFERIQYSTKCNSDQETVEDGIDDELRDENKNNLIQVKQLMSSPSPPCCPFIYNADFHTLQLMAC